jgi:hypothetical protein
MRNVRLAILLAGVLAGCASADDSASGDDANITSAAGGASGEVGGVEGTPEQRAAFEAFATKRGAAPKSGRALAIGIRGRSTEGKVHDTRVVRELDDTLVILTPEKRIVRLAMSTHPWEMKGVPGVPDVDGDNVADVGMIKPGIYTAVRRDTSRNVAGERSFAVSLPNGNGAIPGFRNTNHDDHYSPEEIQASAARGDTLTDILFHRVDGGAPAAVGCQVFDHPGIKRVIAEVGAGFDYLLVDVNSDTNPEEIPQS